ncbi:MAG: hypothetical protein WC997_16115 [Porticoccaceae bacterium]
MLGTIAICSGLVWHWFVTVYPTAVIGSTVTTVVTFQIAAYLHAGYVDPFFPIAVITSSFVAAVIASLIGLLIRARRRLNAEGRKQP